MSSLEGTPAFETDRLSNEQDTVVLFAFRSKLFRDISLAARFLWKFTG